MDTSEYEFRVNGTEVLPGDPVTSFRGERHTFVRISRVPGGGSTGKVTVVTDYRHQTERYPSVYNGEIVRRTDND